MKAICKQCGDSFDLNKEEMELIEEGFISFLDVHICEECADMMNQAPDYSYEMYSDADAGL